ncbi:MAG: DUF6690 family protein [Planctomycetota bacterium]|jgi:hypothetical protein
MFKRILWALPLAVAAGGPVAYFGLPDSWKEVTPKWFSSSETAAAQAASSEALQEDPAAAAPPAPLEGPPTKDLGEVLRFEGVTTGWVLRRWPRVSTGLAELPLQGYRVPLVTGTEETDLAGSLTYYFNAQQRVQRISFRGTTGDPRELVRFLTTRYKFARRLTNDPGLYVYEVAHAGGRPVSVLKLQSAPVVKSSEPNRRFEVELVIERPS